MSSAWYPQDKKELDKMLSSFMAKGKIAENKIHGLIVPHAGYQYSGPTAGKAYSLLKNAKSKQLAVIISPSHYIPIAGLFTHDKPAWKTPLGEINILKNNDFYKTDIRQEHAIDNQIPFLQKLGFKEIFPMLIGELTQQEAKELAKKLSKLNAIFIISTDLSHFLPYNEAKAKDKETISALENLDTKKLLAISNSACGIFPLIIALELCKLNNWKPKLIDYKNSGDTTGSKDSVVGYASLFF